MLFAQTSHWFSAVFCSIPHFSHPHYNCIGRGTSFRAPEIDAQQKEKKEKLNDTVYPNVR